MGRRLALLGLLSLTPRLATADEGAVCRAQATWSICAPGATDCFQRQVAVDATRADVPQAGALALQRCQTQLAVDRLQVAFVRSPTAQPDAVTQVDAPCAVSTCTASSFQPDPNEDAFDAPICIGVRTYICDLCGPQSSLCLKVLTEQPVTASACSDTQARLHLFAEFLDQVDALQPGAWAEARGDLCGPASPEAPPAAE